MDTYLILTGTDHLPRDTITVSSLDEAFEAIKKFFDTQLDCDLGGKSHETS